MTVKWKWLDSGVIVILLLIMAIPAVTQAATVVVSGTVPLAISGVASSAITTSGATVT